MWFLALLAEMVGGWGAGGEAGKSTPPKEAFCDGMTDASRNWEQDHLCHQLQCCPAPFPPQTQPGLVTDPPSPGSLQVPVHPGRAEHFQK